MATGLGTIHRLWEHSVWADRELLRVLRAATPPPVEAIRELAHLVATEEVWLARMERREPRAPVWPEVPEGTPPETALAELADLVERTHAAAGRFLGRLREPDLAVAIDYVNSANDAFVNTVGEILVHAALHGQYHRGKVNLLLRQEGLEPAPCDYIAWARGAPAATRRSAPLAGDRTPPDS